MSGSVFIKSSNCIRCRDALHCDARKEKAITIYDIGSYLLLLLLAWLDNNTARRMATGNDSTSRYKNNVVFSLVFKTQDSRDDHLVHYSIAFRLIVSKSKRKETSPSCRVGEFYPKNTHSRKNGNKMLIPEFQYEFGSNFNASVLGNA